MNAYSIAIYHLSVQRFCGRAVRILIKCHITYETASIDLDAGERLDFAGGSTETKSMKLPLPLLVGAAMAAPMMTTAPVQASAVQDAYLAHLAECIELLLTDPVEHARVCGTGNGPSGRTLPDVTFPEAPPPPPPPPPPDLT